MKTRKITCLALATGLLLSFSACKDDKSNKDDIRLEDQETTAMADTDESNMDQTAMSNSEMADAEISEENTELETNSIAAKAMSNDNLSTLVTALQAAELDQMMKEEGSYTVFAPTNNAFSKLPEGTVENLLKPENKEQLKSVLQYHMVSGKIMSDQLVSAIKSNNGSYTFKTVTGEDLTAMMNGDQIVLKDGQGNTSHVVQGNVQAANGVVHVIDDVIMAKG